MLVHDYFSIDLGAVWHIVAVDIPTLKRVVIAMLAAQENK
jgi:uncharacterized protein with HEPN domain